MVAGSRLTGSGGSRGGPDGCPKAAFVVSRSGLRSIFAARGCRELTWELSE